MTSGRKTVWEIFEARSSSQVDSKRRRYYRNTADWLLVAYEITSQQSRLIESLTTDHILIFLRRLLPRKTPCSKVQYCGIAVFQTPFSVPGEWLSVDGD